MTSEDSPRIPRTVPGVQAELPPGRVMKRGHTAGDFLEAYDWELVEHGDGLLRVRAQVPEHAKNPVGQLFGGFTPTYADLMAILTYRFGLSTDEQSGSWLATLNLRVDYLDPILGRFEMEGRFVRRRGATAWIEVRFLDPDETVLAFALVTLRETERKIPELQSED